MKPNPPTDRRRRRILITLAAAVAVYAVAGFLVLPPVVRSQAVEKMSAALKRPVTIQKVSLNPFTLSVTVRGLAVTDHDGAELAGFDGFHANLQASSLFRRSWYFSAVRLERPRGRLVVGTDGALNIADLMQETPPAAAPAGPAAPPRFMIENLAIEAGSLHFRDLSHPAAFENFAGPVTVHLQRFGSGDGAPGSISLQGGTESGERFAFEGLVNLDAATLAGRWTVTGVHAPKYDPFHSTMTLFEVAGGKISFNVNFVASAKDGFSLKVDPAEFAIEDLHIRARGEKEDAIYLPALHVSGIRVDSTTHTASVERVAIGAFPSGGAPAWTVQGSGAGEAAGGVTTVRATRLADGTFDIAALLTPRGEAPGAAAGGAAGAQWSALVTEFSLGDSRVELTDLTNSAPVHLLLDRLEVRAQNLSTDPSATVRFEAGLRWQEQGTVRAQGTAVREPLHASVEFEAAGISLTPLEPFLDPWVAVRISDGAVRASGQATLSRESPDAEPAIAFEGAAGVDRFVALTAEGGKPLASVSALELRNIRFNSPPVTLDIAEIAVRSPAIDVSIDGDGVLNLSSVMKAREPTETPVVLVAQPGDAAAAPRPRITVGRVVIEDGRADLADHSLGSPFVTSMRDFGGTIAGLSSEELARADVDLKGTLDGTAPFHVSGKINPLSDDAFTDLRVDFRGIGLAGFTPYSGRYVGYTIDRGSLTLDLNYHLSARVLEAENSVVLDDFYLGETVESPDATNLPVKLALALLRDRQGRIDIDMPIRGNLDDPDFRYGKVVWKAVGNLIAKAATAPFSLLGALIPGGGDPEELSQVAFEPGSAAIDDASAAKIATLANALYDRPALNIEIVSRPQPAVDGPLLRAQRFESMLAQRRLEELSRTGVPAGGVAAQDMDADTRAALIRREFAAVFPAVAPVSAVAPAASEAPQDESGIIKKTYRRILGVFGRDKEEPPPPEPVVVAAPAPVDAGPTTAEMEARLLERIEVSPSDLEALANDRAAAIRDHLVATGRVEAGRISVATPAGGTPAGNNASTARVEFVLK